MRLVLLIAAGAAGMLGTAAQAQQSDVNSYLCTFAGKCGTDGQSTDTPTKAAPATKGFRLAAAQATPTVAAPQTKGFHLASAGQTQPTEAAPVTKSFRIAKAAPVAAPSHVAPAHATTRFAVAKPTAMPAPGVARANLMLAFEYNSAQMTPAAEAKAKTFAQALMMDALKDKRFMIEGHTDAHGAREGNIDLSRRRAQSVADFLVTQGVDRSRVEVKGVGPDEPLPGRSAMSEANRRVEAVLLS